MTEIVGWVTAAAAVLAAIGAWVAVLRRPQGTEADAVEAMFDRQDNLERQLRADLQETQRALRTEIAESMRGLRTELTHSLSQNQQALGGQQAHQAQLLHQQLDAFAQNLSTLTAHLQERFDHLRTSLARDAVAAREEGAASLQGFADRFEQQLRVLTEANERRMTDVRNVVETRLKDMQADNGAKLEEMRRTVDEKLHATLEQRLGESFKLVSDRLESVHKGLGEMQTLAAGVGDLKRVLTNVKSRGTWGEVQLGMLIEQIMTPAQYARNVKPVPGSDELVEFAIRLPGRGDGSVPVWLPIDAKFPKEEYERLVDAQDRADIDAVRTAGAAFEKGVELEGRRIGTKYVAPPHTTDFAIMFLPTEGLYAEVLRRTALMDRLQALRINVAGPSNLSALLNSLQMGFRTLAIEQRSSEVWNVLGAVKSEFGKFGEALASVKKTLETASNKIGQTETRTRAMLRNLKSVEALPETDAQRLLGTRPEDMASEEADDAAASPG
ncbi:lipoprotein [Pigmentiphaga litoralis]|uniref:DNA recombination protein RmuC n=2 Tax=Pigmentiphaga litoralis TaxID=516702 RepID=UPI001983ED7E|nr:DNA recombination protein RmuC [Pigmentiphaga litoralis]GGW99582.1 lipoprotein [Pigmentiphaga litoralis]